MKATLGQGERLVYRPVLLATARVHFVRRRPEIDAWNEITLLSPLDEGSVDAPWEAAERPQAEPELCDEGEDDATFAELPGAATRSKSYVAWARELKSVLYRTERLPILTCSDPKATSEAGESETDFERRLRQLAREARDTKLARLEKSYAPRLDRIRNKIRRAEERVARETGQYQDQKRQSTISVGATMLGALLGRRKLSVSTVGRATTAVRGLPRVEREKGDIARAQRVLEDQEGKLMELEEAFRAELDGIRDSSVTGPFELDEISVKPRKTDIGVSSLCLAWAPWRVDPQGIAEPAFTS